MTQAPGRRWLVDGMNVIGTRPDGWWNHRDRAVHDLIAALGAWATRTGQDVTVVFDHRPADLEAGRHGSVDVAFAARRGRNAADYEIASMVAADEAPERVRVVTSDLPLAARVRSLGASVVGAGAFRRRLDADGEPPRRRTR